MTRANPTQSTMAVERGVNAVQEEFDERGLGDATLLVEVILDEVGLPGLLMSRERALAALEVDSGWPAHRLLDAIGDAIAELQS